MHNNKLTVIKEKTFIGLNQLKVLNYYDNELKEIKENAFIGLDNLQELYLERNQLAKYPDLMKQLTH